MYVIIWEYQVKAEHLDEFERIYHPAGLWAELFKRGNGYISTELLRDETHPHRYLTIDRWESVRDYKDFQAKWKEEYEAVDKRCEGLNEKETLIGKWETLDFEPR